MDIELNTPVTTLFGVGDKYAKLLDLKLGIKTVEHLLNHFPQRYEDYSKIKKFGEVQSGEVVTIIGKIVETKNIFTKRIKIQEIYIEDINRSERSRPPTTERIKLTFFNQPFILQSLKKGMTIAVSGTAERFGEKLQFKSPEYELLKQFQISNSCPPNWRVKFQINNLVHTGRLIPIYPETRGISSKWLRARIFPLIQNTNSLISENLDEKTLQKENLISLAAAYKNVHYPESFETLAKSNMRLAFDELLIAQLFSLSKKEEWQKQKTDKIISQIYQKQIKKFIEKLPFSLTNSQGRSIGEIFSDLNSEKPMNRLLEGDVGSGKTIVAASAMYLAYLNGYSSALMCPTEILANQHYTTINKLLSQYEVPIYLVTSSSRKGLDSHGLKPKDSHGTDNTDKNQSVKSAKSVPWESQSLIRENPNAAIYVGTHALIEEKVQIPNLNLVVIDEQHRFGVSQRAKLSQKGQNPHTLTMTATPIPRTIALTFYGNLELSILEELPQKKKIKTWLVPPEKRENAYKWISAQVKKNNFQVFIICPFIEQSETMESVKSAKIEFEKLKTIFPQLKLELLTGKTKPKEKDRIMKEFAKGKFHVLVATPVVEVGIDIPKASLILIEGAERFGLAAIHQLRGRVGRRGQQAFCLLFESEGKNNNSGRLKYLERIDNGLKLAEIDLKIRGSGNIWSTEQHGFKTFRKASLSDLYLVEKAKNAARRIFSSPDEFPVLKKLLKKGKIENIINN